MSRDKLRSLGKLFSYFFYFYVVDESDKRICLKPVENIVYVLPYIVSQDLFVAKMLGEQGVVEHSEMFHAVRLV